MNINLIPRSLASRTSLFLLVVIVLAQLLSGAIWYQHSANKDKQGLLNTIRSLTLSASSTVSFFQTLPSEYRHLVLNQLRNMGGTRFFVSLNNHQIPLTPIAESERKSLVIDEVKTVLGSELDNVRSMSIDFTLREHLKVFNNELPIDELPLLWAHYTLSYGDINPPILVMQIEVAPSEWFYLAAVLPAPYVNLETSFFDIREWLTMFLSAFLLLGCTWLVVRKELRPIRALAKAATLMSSKLKVPNVKEEGSSEFRAAIHAFNKMNRRIDSHINDREMLFSAISHDLKTPIACLKLRSEMLDNAEDRERFSRIANDLDLMVKGALQCIKATDIHEEIELISIPALLEHIISTTQNGSSTILVHTHNAQPYAGKPLAMKRCLQNLIDNGIKYGQKVEIDINDSEESLVINIWDHGKGVDPTLIDKICEPYFRIENTSDKEGNGLGLTITQSIVKAHGGHLSFQPASTGGLCATLTFPRG
ncbi:two-component sensor histidine kinase [Vibrio sp. vnigr-6D03]|uniref:ATP-binding protein n=1 Tax=Vibrio sp. vnigr-6D03 TaxID=2058088 RepID=UPI000C31C6AD|nr:ATP-binding protein [Vibrio sp. vnigr-6D03]PKF80765.1 two-component sensor histidine kinase [Vibrio sp. vnigr-6D03]